METIANLGAIDKLQRRNASFIEYFFVGTEKDIFWLLSLCNIAMSPLRFNYNSFRWIIEFFCNVFFSTTLVVGVVVFLLFSFTFSLAFLVLRSLIFSSVGSSFEFVFRFAFFWYDTVLCGISVIRF